MSAAEVLSNVSNDGASAIDTGTPYTVRVTVEGTSPILFHRWSNEAVAEKAKAAKGSKAKKTDDVESYVYRCADGTLGIPGSNLVGTLIDPRCGAAKFRQDPRSPRKSALDLYKAGVVALTDVATLGTSKWDFLDSRRVVVQRNAVTRVRPGMMTGWRATFELLVMLPEYISPQALHACLSDAGRLVGLCDFRPTYGRFQIVGFEVL